MARINLKDISINTLLQMSQDELFSLAKRGLNKDAMSQSEYAKAHRGNLAEITSRLTSVANRRIKALASTKIGRTSPAYQRALQMSKSGLFSVKGKDWNQLMNTLTEAKQFLSYKTSTQKGWAEVREQIEQDIGGALNTTYKSTKFWEAYRRLSELHGGTMGRKGSPSRLSSERVQNMLYQTITNSRDETGNKLIDWRSKVDKIIELADEEYKEIYKEEKSKRKDVGASRFVK